MVKISHVVLGLFVTLEFHVTNGHYDSFHHKVGENISLPCKNAVPSDCSSTTWLFDSTELVAHGVVKQDSGREKRLQVGQDCSLIVLHVTTEDAGIYTCRQYPTEGGDQYGEDARVQLHIQTSELPTSGSTISPQNEGLTTPLSTTSTPFTVWAAVGGAIGAVVLCLLAVIIIVHNYRDKTKNPNNDTLALTADTVSNNTGNQKTPPNNEDKDEHDNGPTYAIINHSNKNKLASKPDTQQENTVTYASVNVSSSRRN